MKKNWLVAEREILDPPEVLAIGFVVAQDGNFYVSGEDGTGWMR